jgi:hypothetical protein
MRLAKEQKYIRQNFAVKVVFCTRAYRSIQPATLVLASFTIQTSVTRLSRNGETYALAKISSRSESK